MHSNEGRLEGYLKWRLSCFDTNDLKHADLQSEGRPEYCWYRDFRHPPGDAGSEYTLRIDYWHVLAARLACVVVFMNVVGFSVMLIQWIVPSSHSGFDQEVRREAYLTNEIIIKKELQESRIYLGDGYNDSPGGVDQKPTRAPAHPQHNDEYNRKRFPANTLDSQRTWLSKLKKFRTATAETDAENSIAIESGNSRSCPPKHSHNMTGDVADGNIVV